MVKPESISNPRRILAVSLQASTEQLSRVIKDLTGSQPEPTSASLAGTTHDLELHTPYYTATIPIWLDLVAGPPAEWASSFLSDEAKEVLEVLGGIVVVFAIPPETTPATTTTTTTTTTPSPTKDETTALLQEVGKVVKQGLGGWEWDGVRLAVGVGDVGHLDDLDTWDEVCADAGLEFVHAAGTAAAVGGGDDVKNEFGEKVGVPRVLEALEANDWASVGGGGGLLGALDELGDGPGGAHDDDDEQLDFENMNFGFDKDDLEGLRKAIWEATREREEEEGEGEGPNSSNSNSNSQDKPAAANQQQQGAAGAVGEEAEEGQYDDDEIRKVEQMMQKLQAVRDMSAGLPEEQRKRMAAKAVGEVMRDL